MAHAEVNKKGDTRERSCLWHAAGYRATNEGLCLREAMGTNLSGYVADVKRRDGRIGNKRRCGEPNLLAEKWIWQSLRRDLGGTGLITGAEDPERKGWDVGDCVGLGTD